MFYIKELHRSKVMASRHPYRRAVLQTTIDMSSQLKAVIQIMDIHLDCHNPQETCPPFKLVWLKKQWLPREATRPVTSISPITPSSNCHLQTIFWVISNISNSNCMSLKLSQITIAERTRIHRGATLRNQGSILSNRLIMGWDRHQEWWLGNTRFYSLEAPWGKGRCMWHRRDHSILTRSVRTKSLEMETLFTLMFRCEQTQHLRRPIWRIDLNKNSKWSYSSSRETV